jgi:hypothetical protein
MKATPEQGVAPLDIVRNKNAKNVLFAQGQQGFSYLKQGRMKNERLLLRDAYRGYPLSLLMRLLSKWLKPWPDGDRTSDRDAYWGNGAKPWPGGAFDTWSGML